MPWFFLTTEVVLVVSGSQKMLKIFLRASGLILEEEDAESCLRENQMQTLPTEHTVPFFFPIIAIMTNIYVFCLLTYLESFCVYHHHIWYMYLYVSYAIWIWLRLVFIEIKIFFCSVHLFWLQQICKVLDSTHLRW